MKRRHFMSLVIVFLIAGTAGCKAYSQVRQVRTYADMQTITAKLESLRARDSALLTRASETAPLIASVAAGKDAWGHDFFFAVRLLQGRVSYVLISYGADGQPDFKTDDEYFSAADRDVRHEPLSDIIFRDGRAVTFAGK